MRRRSASAIRQLALVATILAIPLSGDILQGAQPLLATAKVISQQNCRNNKETYSVIQKIKVTIQNQGKRNLVIDKQDIGRAFYDMVVARDTNSLSKEKYEWRSNPEWSIEPPPGEMNEKYPVPPFVILAPGDSFQVDVESWVGVRTNDAHGDFGIRSGEYVSQVQLASWFYTTKPEVVEKRWQTFGDLIYKTIKTEPLAFNLSPNPKLETCK
jgi:hypothetical protein